jgi:hypothetical protein
VILFLGIAGNAYAQYAIKPKKGLDVMGTDFKDKSIQYYIDIYDAVRAKTKKLLKTKDDKWFAKKNGSMTNHWAWFHVMEHQANHMGQLALITKRIK